ncbi:MAG: hypothetical protein Q9182_000332 [Xanthomendoza sp. 2 TL-2023]
MAAPVAPHHYKFNIEMSCTGCSGAIDRVLKRLEGVQRYEVSFESKTADVYADEGLAYETVLEKIKKTGKTVKTGQKDGQKADV